MGDGIVCGKGWEEWGGGGGGVEGLGFGRYHFSSEVDRAPMDIFSLAYLIRLLQSSALVLGVRSAGFSLSKVGRLLCLILLLLLVVVVMVMVVVMVVLVCLWVFSCACACV